MICPGCHQSIPLTWQRYLSSPLGFHECDQCQVKFRFRHTPKYYAAITALWLVGGLLPGIICLKLGATLIQAFFAFWFCGLGILLPADKYIDDTWRGTISRKANS